MRSSSTSTRGEPLGRGSLSRLGQKESGATQAADLAKVNASRPNACRVSGSQEWRDIATAQHKRTIVAATTGVSWADQTQLVSELEDPIAQFITKVGDHGLGPFAVLSSVRAAEVEVVG